MSKGDIGLGNVNNTSDIDKPISTATQTALDAKQPTLTAGQNISISGSTIGTKAFPCNPNLLDNWYFGNPVNQRGQTSYTATGYTIDRWMFLIDAGTIEIADGHVSIAPPSVDFVGWLERLEALPLLGQTVTFSALCRCTGSGGNNFPYITAYIGNNQFEGSALISQTTWQCVSFSITFPAVSPSDGIFGFDVVAMTNFGVDVKAVKLELGSEQTLAHQENGVWVLNEIPDYGEQLRRCQRYYRTLLNPNKDYSIVATADTANAFEVDYALNPPMRTMPVLVGDTNGALRIVAYNMNDLSLAIAQACHNVTLSQTGCDSDRVTLIVTPPNELSFAGKYCFTVDTAAISKTLGLSADL